MRLSLKLRLAALAALAVVSGYQVHRPVEIRLGSGLVSALLVHGFHDGEGAYRWTRAESRLVLPDLGPGQSGRIEIDVSGFRPPGRPTPLLFVDVSGTTFRFPTGRRAERVEVPARTEGFWSSSLELRFRSETFSPGEWDRRPLGVRVHRVRWVPDAPALSWSRPALRQIVAATATVMLLFWCLVLAGLKERRAFRVAAGLALALGLEFSFARAGAAVASIPLAVGLGLAAAVLGTFPVPARKLGRCGLAGLNAFGASGKLLFSVQSLALVTAAVVLVSAAYLARPSIEVDLGSGRETTLAKRFGSYDAENGITFRRALLDAEMDLRDFGGGAAWRISVTASSGPEGRFRTESREADAPFGWRAGHVLDFPVDARVDRVEIDRGRSFPSLRVVTLSAGTALALVLALGASGVSSRAAFLGGAASLLAEAIAIFADPLLVVPFTGTFLGVALGGAVLAALTRGSSSLSPGTVAITTLGFVVWLSALTFPLYEGLHFVYHSSIAEEIWQGRFWVYYLPNEENILSREAQWGGMVVPYPCLYHLLMAPLAALPREDFYLLEKVGLALMAFQLAIVSALLARRFGGETAPLGAAFFAIGLYPVFQLLGLGHLLTLFGCWAASLALGFVILFLDELTDRATWWVATGLLTLSFLSYTASLLFVAFVLAAALPFLRGAAPRAARALLGSAALALLAAFVLYYGQWVRPFLEKSVPLLLSPDPSGPAPLFERLAALPGKTVYSYGSLLFPLLGVASLVRGALSPSAGRAQASPGASVGVGPHEPREGASSPLPERLLLLAWASVYPVFSGFDLFFNLILKHHYFVMVPVAVGGGLLVDRLAEKGRCGRWLAAALIVYVLAGGARAALALALGRME